jgi:hypothetical protein
VERREVDRALRLEVSWSVILAGRDERGCVGLVGSRGSGAAYAMDGQKEVGRTRGHEKPAEKSACHML